MAWGQEKGADVKISALRACQYEIFDFVPCSLPLKTLILLTFSCFLIRRRGRAVLLLYVGKKRRAAQETGALGYWCFRNDRNSRAEELAAGMDFTATPSRRDRGWARGMTLTRFS